MFIVLICVLIGILLHFLSLSTAGWSLPINATRDELSSAIDSYFPTWFIESVAGIVGLCILPWALCHDPRETEPEFTGKKFTLFAGAVVCLSSFSPLTSLAGIVAFISAASRRNFWWTLCVSTASFGSIFLGQLSLLDKGHLLPDTLTLIAGLCVLFLLLIVAELRGRQRERQHHILRLAQANQEDIKRRETEARQQERLSIARDMHDSLSHRLSVISLHSGVLELRDDLDGQALKEEAALIRKEASAAVDDLRQVLSTLRTTTSHNPNLNIEQIIAEAVQAGDPVTLSVEESTTALRFEQLPKILQHTLTRAVQEGLTNARKHAPQQPVAVELASKKDHIQLHIHNPCPDHSDAKGTGSGLVGLRERVELVGGSMDTVQGQDSFDLHVSLPRDIVSEDRTLA